MIMLSTEDALRYAKQCRGGRCKKKTLVTQVRRKDETTATMVNKDYTTKIPDASDVLRDITENRWTQTEKENHTN